MGQNTAMSLATCIELPNSKRKANQECSNASAREELKCASPPLYINTRALHKAEGYLNTKIGSDAQCSESDLSPLVMEKISELATAPLSKKMFLTTLKDEVMITL